MQRIGLKVQRLRDAYGDLHREPVAGHVFRANVKNLLISTVTDDFESHSGGTDLAVSIREVVNAFC